MAEVPQETPGPAVYPEHFKGDEWEGLMLRGCKKGPQDKTIGSELQVSVADQQTTSMRRGQETLR